MTQPRRRSGPSPALVLLVGAAVAILVYLGILALRVPAGTPLSDYPAQMADQLAHAWASFFPPTPVTEQGKQTYDLYKIVFGVAALIFVFVEVLIILAIVRYRRKPGQEELPPQVHGNNLLEIVWTVIPTVIVGILFLLSWNTLNYVDATGAQAQETRVRAVAARFQWSFQYLDQKGQILFTQISPEMVVPADTTVHLALAATDVNHAFYVPKFLFKRDAIPGRENVFDFKVDGQYAGQTFHGQCAELCGPQHWAMQFSVKVVTAAEFQAWLQQQIESAKASPSPQPSGGAGQGEVLELTAKNIAYDKTELTTSAGKPFVIKFTNDDPTVSHNVAIHQGSATGPEVWKGEIFQGVDTRNYSVPALDAGTYAFVCTVHPNMVGTLTVK